MHHLFIYVFIFWSGRMAALMLCWYSIAPCNCEGGISACAICQFKRFILVQYIGRPKYVVSCRTKESSFCFYCIVSAVDELEVVVCTHRLTFLSSCDLFSRRKKTRRGQSACKIEDYSSLLQQNAIIYRTMSTSSMVARHFKFLQHVLTCCT